MKCLFIKFFFLSLILDCRCANTNLKLWKDVGSTAYYEKKIFPKTFRDKTTNNVHSKVGTFMDLVENTGYFAEEHEVVTEDEYMLMIHRISGGPGNPAGFGKPVVLLLHGLLGASDIWVVRGPKQDLAYLLVDNGFDVWALNVRGNFYSKRHRKLSDKDFKFWEFSWHETGVYDLPATIDYILTLTGQSKLSLIGHSMGGTEEFVLLSARPEYNDKINIAFAWAPVTTVTHEFPGLFINFLFRYGSEVEEIFQLLHLVELFPRLTLEQLNTAEFWLNLCGNQSLQLFCKKILNLVLGVKGLSFDTSTLLQFWRHYPQGTSLRTIIHYGQIVLSRKFTKYDFGPLENWIKYKNVNPPEYPLEKISTPLIIYHALGDHITNKQDVEAMLKRVPTAIAKEVPHKNFNHIDFILSNTTLKFVYSDVIQILLTYTDNNYLRI